MLRIVRIGTPGQADLAWARKARQVIDMTRGLVSDHALAGQNSALHADEWKMGSVKIHCVDAGETVAARSARASSDQRQELPGISAGDGVQRYDGAGAPNGMPRGRRALGTRIGQPRAVAGELRRGAQLLRRPS